MLAASRPATLARMRFPLGELTKPEVRALAAEAGLPVAAKRRVPGSLLPGRHRPGRVPGQARRLARPPGGDRRPRRARARPPPRPPPLHGRPAQGHRRPGAGAALRARHGRAPPTPSRSARARAGHARGRRPRRALHRPAREVDGSSCATARGRCPAVPRAGAARRSSCASPSSAPRRARPRASRRRRGRRAG